MRIKEWISMWNGRQVTEVPPSLADEEGVETVPDENRDVLVGPAVHVYNEQRWRGNESLPPSYPVTLTICGAKPWRAEEHTDTCQSHNAKGYGDLYCDCK